VFTSVLSTFSTGCKCKYIHTDSQHGQTNGILRLSFVLLNSCSCFFLVQQLTAIPPTIALSCRAWVCTFPFPLTARILNSALVHSQPQNPCSLTSTVPSISSRADPILTSQANPHTGRILIVLYTLVQNVNLVLPPCVGCAKKDTFY
jgi:hypothetical protein